MLPSPLPQSAKTRADAPAAKPATLETLARLTPRLSEPPPHVSSYATLGSAALDTSLQTTRSRKGMFAVIGAIVLVSVVAGGVSFNALHPRHDGPAVAQPVQATAVPASAKSVPLVPPAETPAAGSAFALLPTVAASSLPRAVEAAPPPPPVRRPPWTASPLPRRLPPLRRLRLERAPTASREPPSFDGALRLCVSLPARRGCGFEGGRRRRDR
jgi:hypothetical protein